MDFKEMSLFVWQLPQNVIGFILSKLFACDVFFRNFDELKIQYYVAGRFNRLWSGVSIGNYIIIASNRYATETILRHEYGHQWQSKYLGLFYLILIGLPSLCGNILHRFIKFDYYKQPWEKWADRLGGVER